MTAALARLVDDLRADGCLLLVMVVMLLSPLPLVGFAAIVAAATPDCPCTEVSP